MATLSANNTRLFGRDINTGSGQLGCTANLTTVDTDFSLVPGVNVTGLTKYYSTYNIEPSVDNLVVTLPSSVSLGWKCKLVVLFANPAVVGTTINTFTVNDHLGTTVFVFNSGQTISAALATSTFQSATFLLKDATPTWIVQPDFAESLQLGNAITWHPTNNFPIYKQLNYIGRLGLRGDGTTDINVLIVTPALVGFSTTNSYGGITDFLTYDTSFYTITNTRITFLITGTYFIQYLIVVQNSGGATTTNIVFQLRVNGALPLLPAFVKLGNINTSWEVRYPGRFTAGDFIELLGGKTVVSVGSNTIDTFSSVIVQYLG
jgi:hypothetical protein